MISVNSTPMPMEAIFPLHTGLIDGLKFSVNDIIPGFIRGKLLTIESYWLSIPQKISPYSHITGNSSQINPGGLGVVW